MSVKDLPADARPREKLLARRPQALADAELLALLLRTGVAGTDVLQLAQRLPADFGGLRGLMRVGPGELARVRGLGPAKRAELAAVLEIARRAMVAELAERPVFDAPQTVRQYRSLQLAHLAHEVFAVLFLDHQHRLLAMEELFRGTLSQTSVYPREAVKRALALNASAVILAQPPVGVGRAVARRRIAHPVAEERARAGRREGVRPHGRRGGRGRFAKRGLL